MSIGKISSDRFQCQIISGEIFSIDVKWNRLTINNLRRIAQLRLNAKYGYIMGALFDRHIITPFRGQHPALAMSPTYTDARGEVRRNLISTCKACHETVAHPERRNKLDKKKPLTVERW